ncbi:phosphate transport system permease protein PstA [Geothrix limicola]|uniref:Phosphate transport system permease protein PstA n=1 Tax=Geothrix limicola TaxID=2927978 RepID=A0ABQ5QC03_9BACT|nr:phosphate ABC transporter permease PstA [Geothrix limicola]GLH72354.1 phosphate transport system permease protein PstA [Geothrix limicola]
MSRLGERFRQGGIFVWFSGTLLAFCLAMILCLVGYIVAKGMGYFWPSPLAQVQTSEGPVLGEITGHEPAHGEETEKLQFRVGNRDVFGQDFRWIPAAGLSTPEYPKEAVLIERLEYGPFIGRVASLSHEGQTVATGTSALQEALKHLPEAERLRHHIQTIEKGQVGDLNRRIEKLRLSRHKLEAKGDVAGLQALDAKTADLQSAYDQLQTSLEQSRAEAKAWTLSLQTADGQIKECPLGSVVRVVPANALGPFGKVRVYLSRLWEFVADDPRESNTEGGIFPAIFGTVMMVLVMSVLVVPLGVITALYLREYARQGWLVRAVRVAVNNLAGVPSIVFGVFGLGFFVYGLGGTIDKLFFADSLPTPTYGTGGILWASLTLALLTVPVVVVATEEALGAVPRSQREASLAMGATKWQTLWKVVLPSATPGILTGLILAIARGAGEVAPLMLTGVVKLAPAMPLDSTFPFLHLDRKFMHLGFHIYDVGFQSPNSEAAKPMVFMASFLLLLVVVVLNLFALNLRRKLRERLGGSTF